MRREPPVQWRRRGSGLGKPLRIWGGGSCRRRVQVGAVVISTNVALRRLWYDLRAPSPESSTVHAHTCGGCHLRVLYSQGDTPEISSMGPGQGRAGGTEGPGREGGDSGPRWGRFQALLPSTPAPGAGGPEPVRAWRGGIPERWAGVSVTTCGEAASLPGPPLPPPTPSCKPRPPHPALQPPAGGTSPGPQAQPPLPLLPRASPTRRLLPPRGCWQPGLTFWAPPNRGSVLPQSTLHPVIP